MTGRWLEDRRLWWALSAVAALLALFSALDGRVVQPVAWAVIAGWWLWHGEHGARRSSSPSPRVDDAWARGVLADAGEPTGVRAVKALRQAEPALSLLAAKELADRVAR